MKSKIVISCFDLTTIMVQPWANDGYTCYCIDINHPKGITREDNIYKIGIDIFDWLPPKEEVVFASFFPPCTDIAASGARWFKQKGLNALWKAIRLFDISVRLAEWFDAPYMIENPVSTISTYWRKPNYTFDPCDYGDPYTKKTCLWTGNGFVMPLKNRVEPIEGSKIHLMPETKRRQLLRCKTPAGFAKAVFEANRLKYKKRGQ